MTFKVKDGLRVGSTLAIDANGKLNTGLSTARNIALSGDVTGNANFDGAANITIAASIPSIDASKITSGTIDAARLPSYVDDVLEYANLAGFPGTGTAGKIYLAIDTNKAYRWSGSAYVYITSGAVDSVNAGNAITVSSTTGIVTVNHADTSSVANLSSDNANGVVIQDLALTFDTYGHVTGQSIATVDLDGRYYTETESDNRFVNVTGDTMTGSLNFTTADTGITWNMNTDGASIKFYNTGDGDTDSRLEFNVNDNTNEDFRFTYTTGGATTELLRMMPDGGQTGITFRGNTVWHAGSDGSGSGLDADLLDGNHASAFATSVHTHGLTIGNGSTTQVTYTSAETLHLVAGTNVSIAYDDANNKVTINSSDTNTDTLQSISDDTDTNATYYPSFVTATSGAQTGKVSSTKLTFNPSSGNLLATKLESNAATGTAPLTVASTTLVSNLNADLLDGYDSSFFKIKYTAIVRRAVWSRIAKLEVEQLFGSLYVTFRHTRNSVVVGNTLLVTFGHYGHGQLVLLGSHGYSQVEVRVVGDGTGNNVYLEILDNNTSDGTDDNDYTVTLDNISCTVTKYTTFTDGTQASPPIYSSITTANNEIILDGNKVWHQGNDGAGSGLDADLLDGNHASAFALSGHTHSYYIGTTQVQTSSANQAVTGITSVTGGTGNTDLGIYTSDATATNTNTGILRVATGNALSGNASSGALALYTGSAQGSSSAGLVSIYAGNSGPSAASGGNVTIVGGSVSAPTSTGGYVLIRGGTALTGASTAGTGGSVHLVGGYAYAASGTKIGGNVYLEGGAPFNAGTNTNGSVYLGTNAAAINNSGTAAVYIGSSSITTTITGTVKLPTVGTSGFVKLSAGGQLSADTNTYALSSHTHPWSSITSTPTTLSGYGITDAEYKQPLNTARNNLGDPTIRDAALFHGQFNNKFRFIAPTSQEESADGTTWVASTRATTDQLKDLMIGEGQGTSFTAIPTGALGTYGGYRLTWDVVSTVGYIFLNYLYFYNSTNGNSVNVLVEAYHNTNGWVTISGPNSFANWPGHTSVPHSSIPYSANASQYGKVRVTFSTTHNAYTNSFDLFGIEWFGGYPQGRRNVEYYDRNKNVFYPAVVNAVDFNSTSDARKKKDVAPVESGLDVLSKLSPVSFKWSETEAKSYGLIAQEVEKVLPELVHTNSDGFKSLAYIPLIAFLIDAVQDLSAEVQKLKSTN